MIKVLRNIVIVLSISVIPSIDGMASDKPVPWTIVNQIPVTNTGK